MKIYILSKKVFYKDKGIVHQIPDYGDLPQVYTCKKRANQAFKKIIKEKGGKYTEIELFPFTNWQRKKEIAGTEYRFVYTLQETEI